MTEENEEDRLRHTRNNHFDNNFYSAMVAYIILVRFELYLSLNYGIFFILRLSLFIFFIDSWNSCWWLLCFYGIYVSTRLWQGISFSSISNNSMYYLQFHFPLLDSSIMYSPLRST